MTLDITPEYREAAARRAISILWHRGNLRYKLHETQLKIREAIQLSQARGNRKFFVLCSRRLGKSYMLVAEAFSLALRKPGARILYLAPWQKDAADIANDLAVQILADCPSALRPKYNAQAKEFEFHNGSVVRLRGVNGEHAQYLRGGAADLIILDEAGLMDGLNSIVSDVCLPMTLTTGGNIVLASTPPKSPGHESCALYEELAAQGSAAKFTLLDAPHIPLEAKGEMLRETREKPERIPGILAGTLAPESTTARREFFCEFVTDADSAVLPEFDAEARKAIVVQHPRPEFFDCYVAMDPGMRDASGILFAYYDFLNGCIVIEDEALLRKARTDQIAAAIKEKEEKLWGYRKPSRISDIDLRLIADLQALHGLSFYKAQKEDSLGAINLMRNDVHARRLRIDPRCVNLVRQMENVVWDTRGKDFARAGDMSLDAHYDLVAALKYLCRAVSRTKNPYPAHYYAVGGKLGLPAGSYVSRKNRKRGDDLGLHGDTPLGRLVRKGRK